MALSRTKLLFRAVGPVLWRKRMVRVLYSTGEEGGGNDGLYANNEHPRSFLSDPFQGASQEAFPKEISKILMAPINHDDIETKLDGLLYLPEIKYRRILNQSFGPGGWALLPRGESLQFQAVGEHTFYGQGNMVYGKAMEAAKSNALVRCCKDLGIASELWDPKFVSDWKEQFAKSIWCEHAFTAEKRKLWLRSDRDPAKAVPYPWKMMAPK